MTTVEQIPNQTRRHTNQ